MSLNSPEEPFSQNLEDQQVLLKKTKRLKLIGLLLVFLVIICGGILGVVLLTGSSNDEGGEEKKDDGGKEEEKSNSTTKFNKDYKIIGYYPNWYGDYTDKVEWDELTHIAYAFGFPSENGSGSMQSLKEFSYVVKPMVDAANQHGVIPMISIGGWLYYGTLCSELFENNTNSEIKINSFAESIVNESMSYGFKGIDICWEYPTEKTKENFSKLMLKLRELCNKNNLTLSAAVAAFSGTGFSNEVLKKLDFINIMAYDGDNGAGHSPFDYAQKSFELWRDLMGVPANKLIIGVPFYAKPGEISYDNLIAADDGNADKDEAIYNGETVYYNGIPTMVKKVEYSIKNGAAGIMYWEASQDTTRKDYSLLKAIYDTVVKHIGLAKK